jgi:hypothetical protein
MRFKNRTSTRTAPTGSVVQLEWLPRSIEHVLRGYYLAWRRECLALQAAYERWLTASEGSRAYAYASYLIVLEREEDAAGQYARGIELSR